MKNKLNIVLLIVFMIINCNNSFSSDKNVSKNDVDNIKIFISNLSNNFDSIKAIKNEKEKEEKTYKLSNELLDLDWIGNFILGKYRRTIEQQDKNEFIENYSKILIKNYISILDVYEKDSYEIISVENIKDNVFNVLTIINYNNKEVKNNFRIIKKNDKFFIIDIITEGVSFISAQRSQVNSVIASKGFNNFLEELKQQNEK